MRLIAFVDLPDLIVYTVISEGEVVDHAEELGREVMHELVEWLCWCSVWKWLFRCHVVGNALPFRILDEKFVGRMDVGEILVGVEAVIGDAICPLDDSGSPGIRHNYIRSCAEEDGHSSWSLPLVLPQQLGKTQVTIRTDEKRWHEVVQVICQAVCMFLIV
jgi:hypothetical protein